MLESLLAGCGAAGTVFRHIENNSDELIPFRFGKRELAVEHFQDCHII